MNISRLAACLLASTLGGLASAGPGVWTTQGPHGGEIDRLFANPAVPGVLYAATSGGIFRSSDGGVSWTRKEAGLTAEVGWVGMLTMDADAPATLWLVDGFGRINRSTDGGDNWALTGYTFATGLANDIVDVPGSTGKLLVATYVDGVLVSNDSGASFLPSNAGLPLGVPIAKIAVDPSNPLRVVAGTGYADTSDPLHPDTLYLSSDGGMTWTGRLTLGGSSPFYGVVVDVSFGAGSVIYAAIDGVVYRSDDDGMNWTGPLLSSDGTVQSVQADPLVANTVWIGSRGLLRSTDGGATATPHNSGLEVIAGAPAVVTRVTLHPNYPTTPQLWLGTRNAGVYFSASNGSSWTARNDGLAAVNVRALAMFHDASTHRLFAGYGDPFTPSPALFRGNNAGPGLPFTSWAPANTNLAAYQIRSVTIDPTTRSGGIGSTRIYATGRAGQPWDIGPKNGGIYRSIDGGNTWNSIDAGLPSAGSPPAPFVGTVRSLVLDPRSCASPPPSGPCTSGPLQTLYATANGQSSGGIHQFRVIKSSNGGDSWTSADSGIPQPIDPGAASYQYLLVVPIVINPANPQELYVGTTAIFDTTAVASPTIQSGVYKSTDGGASWVWRSNGLPHRAGSASTVLDVLSLAINPNNPQELWCSVVDLGTGGGASGGIYHSTDGGANWSNASTGITSVDVRALIVDSTNPAVLYAAGAGSPANPGSIYKSVNSGASWTSISVGLPAGSATALHLDPVDASVLYAGTDSGVWSLTQLADADADGVPDSIEQAAPNGGDGNYDGTADAQQAAVGSLPSTSGGNGLMAPHGDAYFTVAVTPLSGDCSQAVDVQSMYAAYHGHDVSDYGDNYAYPHQLARFEITDCDQARVTLKFHGASFTAGYSLRFYGPAIPGDPTSMGWHDFSERAQQVAPDSWQLTLDNGQFGSYRPATAHSILFEGGPAFHDGIFRDGFN